MLKFFKRKNIRDIFFRIDHTLRNQVNRFAEFLFRTGNTADQADFTKHGPVEFEADIGIDGIADHDDRSAGFHPIHAGRQGIGSPHYLESDIETAFRSVLHDLRPIGIVAVEIQVKITDFTRPGDTPVIDFRQRDHGSSRLSGKSADHLADNAVSHDKHPVTEPESRFDHGMPGDHQGIDKTGRDIRDGIRQLVGI